MGKRFILVLILSFIFSYASILKSQQLDTLIDVGGYKIHFNIIKGKGTPILFEAGSGAYGTYWDSVLPSIHKVTGTTLITYDRAGFGQSEINSNDTIIKNHGIENGIKDLETGLRKLGYGTSDFITVCHSYGGFYSTLFAARHPDKVKYVIRLDAILEAAFTEENLKLYHSAPVDRSIGLGRYYETSNFPFTVRYMRKIIFPAKVPVIDVIAGIPYHAETPQQTQEFENAHRDFVKASPNRKLVVATGSQHDICFDNPEFVINAVIKAYIETLDKTQKQEILKKALENAIDQNNVTRQNTWSFLKSENNLNELGYLYLESEQIEKACEVFKLNIVLFPESWIAFDSYGEGLLAAGKKEESKKMYEKSLQLNPKNDNAILMLEKIKKGN